MTSAIVYAVASGQAFFVGVVLVSLAALLGFAGGGRWPALGRMAAALWGLALVAFSATPLPPWYSLLAGPLVLAWLVTERGSGLVPACGRRGLRIAVLAACAVGAAIEIPYHIMPAIAPMGAPTVFVVGDSISAGMGTEADTWPRILARRHGVRVRDLSLAGATVATALRDQAPGVTGTDALVVVEIGGNDVLGETSSEAFEQGLDALLARLSGRGRTIVMLELPLPPFRQDVGAAQRRQARRHDVVLVPKRVLLGVLTSPGATLDTIHLSPSGHRRMAEAVWSVLRSALGSSAHAPNRGAALERETPRRPQERMAVASRGPVGRWPERSGRLGGGLGRGLPRDGRLGGLRLGRSLGGGLGRGLGSGLGGGLLGGGLGGGLGRGGSLLGGGGLGGGLLGGGLGSGLLRGHGDSSLFARDVNGSDANETSGELDVGVRPAREELPPARVTSVRGAHPESSSASRTSVASGRAEVRRLRP
jgi:acyl-CoA thioesterase-1